MQKYFLVLWFCFFVTISSAQNVNEFKMSKSAMYYLTMNNSSVNYGMHPIPYTESYIKDNKIKRIRLEKTDDDDIRYNDFNFSKSGRVTKIENHFKNDKELSWTYTFKECTPSVKIFTDKAVTSFGDLKSDYVYKFSEGILTHFEQDYFDIDLTEINIGQYIVTKDDGFASRCIIYVNEPKIIYDQDVILDAVSTIVERHSLQSRNGVIVEIRSFKDDKVFENFIMKYSHESPIIDKYEEIEAFLYEGDLLMKIVERKYISGEERRVTTFTYNNKRQLVSVFSSGGGDYDKKITITYKNEKIDIINIASSNWRNKPTKRSIYFSYDYY